MYLYREGCECICIGRDVSVSVLKVAYSVVLCVCGVGVDSTFLSSQILVLCVGV